MSKITFERIESEVRFHNPLRDFAEDLHKLEIRKDPLLGDVSVYNPYLKDKAKAFFGECDAELIRRLVEESAKTCFFCGEKVEKATPLFTSDYVAEGRIRVGEALLFPNLFSLGTHHPVICLCKAHFLKLCEFNPGLMTNGLTAAQKFLKIVYERDGSAAFSAVTANYLFPAGASLVHPHLQMVITPVPYSYHARLLDACSSYYRENGSSYFIDLVREEATGPRYVAGKGKWHWLAPFSPMGNNEFLAIHETEADFGALTLTDLTALSYGISRVLAFYETLGHLSFNYAVYSVKADRSPKGFRCLVKIICRQNLYPNYRNDDYFLQKLLQSELIITPPEETAALLRGYFS
jgi:UDPglucose--hexose-1-phosphate uridylyltransferase